MGGKKALTAMVIPLAVAAGVGSWLLDRGPAADRMPAAPLPPSSTRRTTGLGGLSGRVVDVDSGRGALGAWVRIERAGGGLVAKARVTIEAGEFQFQDLPAGPGYQVVVTQGGCACVRRDGVSVKARTITDTGEYDLRDSVALTVKVTDGADRPIPGAKISLYEGWGGADADDLSPQPNAGRASPSFGLAGAPVVATADDAGSVRVEDVRPGPCTVVAEAAGYAPSSRRSYLSGGNPRTTLVVRLGIGNVIEGTVTDAEGRWVHGTVLAGWGNRPYDDGAFADGLGRTCRIGPKGRYRLTGLPMGRVELRVLRPGLATVPVGSVLVPAVSRFDVHVPAGGVIEGTVTGPGGAPVPGARVLVTDEYDPELPDLEVYGVTDPEGRYRIAGLPGGMAVVRATKAGSPAGWLPLRYAHPHFLSNGVVVSVDLRLTPRATPPRRGVRAGDGRPPPLAHVMAVGKPAVKGEGAKTVVSGVVLLPSGGRAGEGVVRVVHEPADMPPPRSLVEARTPTGGDWRPLAADGSFVLDGVAPGASLKVVALVPGYPTSSSTVFRLAADGTVSQVRVQLEPGLTLRGEVESESGRPLAGVAVRLSCPSTFVGPPCDGDPVSEQGVLAAQTDARGRFVVRGLAPGKYSVSVRRAGLTPLVRSGIDPAAGPVGIRMRKGRPISGVVVDESGEPQPGLEVVLIDSREMLSGFYRITTTGRDGRFEFRDVSDHEYGVMAQTETPGRYGEVDAVGAGRTGIVVVVQRH